LPRLLALLVALCLLVPAAAPAAVPPPADGQLLTAQREREIAPGLRLATFDTYDARGWLRAHLLTADLGARGSTPTLLGIDVEVTGGEDSAEPERGRGAQVAPPSRSPRSRPTLPRSSARCRSDSSRRLRGRDAGRAGDAGERQRRH
jgi:hypothetical protein